MGKHIQSPKSQNSNGETQAQSVGRYFFLFFIKTSMLVEHKSEAQLRMQREAKAHQRAMAKIPKTGSK